MLSAARHAQGAVDDAALRRGAVGSATTAAAPAGAPDARERWANSGAAVAGLVGRDAPEDLELAMLDRRAALLREELAQLGGGQDAALSEIADEVDRSVAWAEEHLYRDLIASHPKGGGADHAAARVCVLC